MSIIYFCQTWKPEQLPKILETLNFLATPVILLSSWKRTKKLEKINKKPSTLPMPDGGRSYMDDFNNQLQAMLLRNTNHTEERPVVPSKSDEPQTISPDSPAREVVLYQTDDGNVNVSVFYYNDNFWLTQKAMGELFDCSSDNISLHLKNIFSSGELDKNSVTEKFSATASDGKNYLMQFYNLDAIIAVGYRVNSMKATKFRQWATATLKEYMIKGFVLNDDMLKNGPKFGKDYFKELLERVRSIRASERRIWQQVTDIFAECSIDYDRNSPITNHFYAMVQNKFHYAITGQTAAEIIYSNADHTKDHMGLTTWKNAPEGRVLKSDVSVAKNYLNEKQIRQLERAVSGYFDYVEDLIERENTFTMEEFAQSINEFLAFRKYDILPDNGKVTSKSAREKAEQEYMKFNKTQKIISDFDKEIQHLLEKH